MFRATRRRSSDPCGQNGSPPWMKRQKGHISSTSSLKRSVLTSSTVTWQPLEVFTYLSRGSGVSDNVNENVVGTVLSTVHNYDVLMHCQPQKVTWTLPADAVLYHDWPSVEDQEVQSINSSFYFSGLTFIYFDCVLFLINTSIKK